MAVVLIAGFAGCAHPVLPPAFASARTLDGRCLPPERQYWTAFRNPSQSNSSGLYLLQPFQTGRVPLVLIHGLASDAFTWNETITALYANPEISSRYQIWVYQYPTGLSYLQTAADLRQELLSVKTILDPDNADSAIDRTVLVGHSMGGLLARLQVSYSDDHLWRAISDVPLDDALNSGRISQGTASAVLFQPVSFVKKVVYIATPHQGSNWTQQPLGRLGRWLINVPDQVRREYSQLLGGNRESFGNAGLRPSTSLDHLTPGNTIIRAASRLRYAEGVDTHSIVGFGYYSPDGCPGDGVVAFQSAHRSDVKTEIRVKATHSGILKNPIATAELVCILTQHQ